jgi:hypothetical protein
MCHLSQRERSKLPKPGPPRPPLPGTVSAPACPPGFLAPAPAPPAAGARASRARPTRVAAGLKFLAVESREANFRSGSDGGAANGPGPGGSPCCSPTCSRQPPKLPGCRAPTPRRTASFLVVTPTIQREEPLVYTPTPNSLTLADAAPPAVCAHRQHSFPGLAPACIAAGLTIRYLCKGPQFNVAALEGIKVVIIFADG